MQHFLHSDMIKIQNMVDLAMFTQYLHSYNQYVLCILLCWVCLLAHDVLKRKTKYVVIYTTILMHFLFIFSPQAHKHKQTTIVSH